MPNTIINEIIDPDINNLLLETYTLPTELISILSVDVNNYYISAKIPTYFKLLSTSDSIDVAKVNNYIFDLIIISKLYAIIYRLYWYHYNITCEKDKVRWINFCENQKLILYPSTSDNKSNITNNEIHIYKLFDISNLHFNDSTLINYDNIYNIDADILDKYNKYNDKYIPLYDNINDNTKKILNTFSFIFSTDVTEIAGLINLLDSSGFSKSANFTSLSSLTDNAKKRFTLYIDEFKNILSLNSNNFDAKLKYKMYYYNFVLYNAIIQLKLPLLKTYYVNKSTQQINDIKNDIEILNNNLKYIIKNKNKKNIKTIKNINEILDVKDINNSIITFSAVTDKYKNEWKIYNKGLFYYRLLLILIMIIFIIIVIISNLVIDINIIINIFIIKILILILIIIILYYYKQPKIEHFASYNDDNDNYKLTANNYINYINNFFNYENNYDYKKIEADDFKLKNSYAYKLLESNNIDNLSSTEYEKKIEYYKIKSIDLEDAIKVLKISNNQNYYIILMIYYTFIFALIGLIFYYQYPDKFYTILCFISICFIIMILIISIKMHKSNNTNNNYYYWSNLNPSSLNEND